MVKKRNVRIDYTDATGKRSWILIRPVSILYGQNHWHPEEQWLLTAVDVKREQTCTFAMKQIHAWESA